MAKKNLQQQSDAPRSVRGFSSGITAVIREFPFYSVESEMNLKGKLVDCINMPPQTVKPSEEFPTGKKPWKALLFIATAETEARTRDGEIIMVQVGDYVGIGMSASLVELEAVARNPHEVVEIELFAKEKIDLGGGKTFRPYEYGTGEVSERTHALLAQRGDVTPTARQLPPPSTNGASAGAGQVALRDN